MEKKITYKDYRCDMRNVLKVIIRLRKGYISKRIFKSILYLLIVSIAPIIEYSEFLRLEKIFENTWNKVEHVIAFLPIVFLMLSTLRIEITSKDKNNYKKSQELYRNKKKFMLLFPKGSFPLDKEEEKEYKTKYKNLAEHI